jgi:hypothetical protein
MGPKFNKGRRSPKGGGGNSQKSGGEKSSSRIPMLRLNSDSALFSTSVHQWNHDLLIFGASAAGLQHPTVIDSLRKLCIQSPVEPVAIKYDDQTDEGKLKQLIQKQQVAAYVKQVEEYRIDHQKLYNLMYSLLYPQLRARIDAHLAEEFVTDRNPVELMQCIKLMAHFEAKAGDLQRNWILAKLNLYQARQSLTESEVEYGKKINLPP